jgi:hypothetical protein
MKTNTRGDSGLSDSGFQKSQVSFLRSHQEVIDKFEQCSETEIKRFKSISKKNNNLWLRIKKFFSRSEQK